MHTYLLSAIYCKNKTATKTATKINNKNNVHKMFAEHSLSPLEPQSLNYCVRDLWIKSSMSLLCDSLFPLSLSKQKPKASLIILY